MRFSPILAGLSLLITAGAAAAQEMAEWERQLRGMEPERLARKVEQLGDPRRGGLFFFRSAAACIQCHDDGSSAAPATAGRTVLGPRLTDLGHELTAQQVVESILYPSRKIREGFATIQVTTVRGNVVSGLLVSRSHDQLVLRDAHDLTRNVALDVRDIEQENTSPVSLMPEGLAGALRNERQFYDLAKYVWEVARGGRQRADQLRPSAEQLLVSDDTRQLDHAGILRRWNDQDLEAGKRIYFGHCVNCHGADGNRPSLPSARAFGAQALKFGGDPWSMLKTLTMGNGLMAPMQHLSPRERYQVIYFIRESLMKDGNPGYQPITEEYLAGLPRGTDRGEWQMGQDRDFGPVLASQLGSDINHSLTFRLPHGVAVNYDLHRFRLGGAWTGGLLNLAETQHYRQRGEQMPRPAGPPLAGLGAYAWELEPGFELSSNIKPRRGPVREDVAQYQGHYLYGNQAVLSYTIHGREVLETLNAEKHEGLVIVTHTLRVQPGERPLRLRVAQADSVAAASSRTPSLPADAPLQWLPISAAGPVPPPAAADARQLAAADARQLAAVARVRPEAVDRSGEHGNVPWHQLAGKPARDLDLGTPSRTILARFRTATGGTLIASAPAAGQWEPHGKTLFIRGGRLVFDIGWVGAITGKTPVTDDRWHTAAVTVTPQSTQLYLDGKREGSRAEFLRSPVEGQVLKVGTTATNFGGDFRGQIAWLAIIDRALGESELQAFHRDEPPAHPQRIWTWSPEAPEPPLPQAVKTALMPDDRLAVATAVISDTANLRWQATERQEAVLAFPASRQPIVLQLLRATVRADELGEFLACAARRSPAEIVDPEGLTQGGGPQRWPEQLAVTGVLGDELNGYALDTIPVPFENPWNAWLRTSALDFFEDGRCVLTTYGGDVYLLDGVDRSLRQVRWKRFAAGLFEPFGVRVVQDRIYVTCRDGLKRLHDLDGDGEADFIEAFWNDDDVSSSFHAFNFDLQTDTAGNFYFAKSGQYTSHHRPGSIMKVPAAGGRAEVVAWGLRTPNGMGQLNDGRLTVSDNQGPWMPAGKISLIKPGGFYGNMPINAEQDGWLRERNGGELPATLDEPVIWLPQELDNSCGGQVWASDARWGPLAGRLIHSSFGKGWLYYLSLQEAGGVMQGAIVPLPQQWSAGVMRLRVNPADGQLYGTGLSGWQGPVDGADGCLQRLRYTGRPARIIERAEALPGRIVLTFNFALSRDAADTNNWQLQMWNYLWSAKYGSDQFSILRPGQTGRDALPVKQVDLSADGKQVTLTVPELRVCDQLWIQMVFDDAQGQTFDEQLYMTVHSLGNGKF